MALSKKSVTLPRGKSVTVATSRTLSDRGSIFVARAAYPANTEAEGNACVAMLRQQEPSADHNMVAYRLLVGPGKKQSVVKHYDDDGEAHGGQRVRAIFLSECAAEPSRRISPSHSATVALFTGAGAGAGAACWFWFWCCLLVLVLVLPAGAAGAGTLVLLLLPMLLLLLLLLLRVRVLRPAAPRTSHRSSGR